VIKMDFADMRRAMVESQLRTNSVTDVRVTAAMDRVAREDFVPAELRAVAYVDRPLPLSTGRTLNPPLATARLLNEAVIGKDDKVLLVGAATGYAAAVLGQLAGVVIALEVDQTLVGLAQQNLVAMNNVEVVSGALELGWSAGAPYDIIIVDGAIAQVPVALSSQLAENGRLVTGIVDSGVTRLAYGRRVHDGFGLIPITDAEAVVLPGFDVPKTFSF
jgi:protein-L-isoaspartate(D-aspartate) O-methyltransferase